MSLAGKALARFREGGVPALGRSLISYTRRRCEDWWDAGFDRKYGVRTTDDDLDLVALGAGGEHLADAHGYEPIQIPIFRAMVRAAGIDSRTHLFVDFGCGKGRALILAAECGFRRVVGVEFAPTLYRKACYNVDSFRRVRPDAPPIAVHLGDAVTYPIPREDAVLYFYNPFEERVFQKVAKNIEASFRVWPRKLVIAYRNPVNSAPFDSLRCVRQVARNRSFAIYRS